MLKPLRFLALLALACVAWVDDAPAQQPKVGRDWYEDPVDIGFKFKAPDGWGYVPPQVDDYGLIGKYVAPGSQFIQDPKTGQYWDYTLYILKFDRRAAADGEPRKAPKGTDTVAGLVEAALPRFSLRQIREDEGKIGGIETREHVFEGVLGNGYPVGLHVTFFQLRPDVDVALAFNGPGGRNWKKFERAFEKISKTLQRIDVTAAAPASAGRTPREIKRADLLAEVAKSPGWELHETDNYFVVSSNDDRAFLQELMERLEAIRTVYEETYPPQMAEELRVLAAQRKVEEKRAAEGEEPASEPDEGEPDHQTTSAPGDPMALSRTSVVRVCKDRDEYISYGGPPGSAGYWHPGHKELVVYDDKAVGGRDDTWATLNHEAFHQYIFYFFGQLAPHYWYNEGTGDFYSGYEYKNKRFNLKPFDWRQRLIQQAVRDNTYTPLQDFVRYDRAKYYDPKTRGQNYAQGWALVYFLRTGKKNARCWDDRWDTILDVYLRVLVESDDLDEAVDAAFAGVDWKTFEECWKSYTLQ